MEVIGDCPECKAINSMTIAELYTGNMVTDRAAYCVKCQLFVDIDAVIEANRQKLENVNPLDIFK